MKTRLSSVGYSNAARASHPVNTVACSNRFSVLQIKPETVTPSGAACVRLRMTYSGRKYAFTVSDSKQGQLIGNGKLPAEPNGTT